MIPALAFLPLEEVEPAFDLVVEEITGEVELLSLEEAVLEKIDLLAFIRSKERLYEKNENVKRFCLQFDFRIVVPVFHF